MANKKIGNQPGSCVIFLERGSIKVVPTIVGVLLWHEDWCGRNRFVDFSIVNFEWTDRFLIRHIDFPPEQLTFNYITLPAIMLRNVNLHALHALHTSIATRFATENDMFLSCYLLRLWSWVSRTGTLQLKWYPEFRVLTQDHHESTLSTIKT